MKVQHNRVQWQGSLYYLPHRQRTQREINSKLFTQRPGRMQMIWMKKGKGTKGFSKNLITDNFDIHKVIQ